MKAYLPQALIGLGFGFALSAIGFSNWDEVHNMFRFADLRLVLVFGGAVALNALAFAFVKGSRTRWLRHFNRGTIPGAVLFGIGWALTGACPSIAVVQLGEGQLPAAFTIGGILIGNALYQPIHARFFKWDVGSCEV